MAKLAADRWDFAALTPPERLHAVELAAAAAFTNSLAEIAAPIAAPPAAPSAALAPTPEPARAGPPPVPLPRAEPPGPATHWVAGPRAPRRPLPARLTLPAGLAVTAAGVVGLVASVTATPRIGPLADPAALVVDAPATVAAETPERAVRRPRAPRSLAATPPAGPRPLARSRPLLVEVARVGVRADVTELGLRHDGSLDVPEDERVSGWYAGGPAPGQAGAAVVVGHVDSADGPGVFHPLLRAAVGDDIAIRRADGSRVVFRVYRVAAYPKTSFPTDLVYRANGIELRLVTCSGEFDRRTRHYRDNLVVFARRVA
ncbi:MAG TPA: class F sortase [Frankiaceae bacterium]|nr:class F sortase [Frankiaceae bacterium]